MSRKLLTVVFAAAPLVVFAQIPYSGGEYTQDFDTLESGAIYTPYTNLPIGWIVSSTWNSGTYVWTTVTNGFSNNYGKYCFSLMPGDPDKSIGLVIGSTGLAYLGARFRNDTGVTLKCFTLSYHVEQWRKGAVTGSDQNIPFHYSLNATNLDSDMFLSVTPLDLRSIHDGDGTAAAMNGNAVTNRQQVSSTVSGISWMPGQELWLRWMGARYSFNSAHALAVDDLSFRAVPKLRMIPIGSNRFQASWSAQYNNFRLQSAVSPTAAEWIPVAATRVIVGDELQVNVDTMDGQRFFRLQMQ